MASLAVGEVQQGTCITDPEVSSDPSACPDHAYEDAAGVPPSTCDVKLIFVTGSAAVVVSIPAQHGHGLFPVCMHIAICQSAEISVIFLSTHSCRCRGT